MDDNDRREFSESLERFTELPMLCLAIAFVPIVIVPWAFELSAAWDAAFNAASWIIWAAFAAELVAKTYFAPQRLVYLRRHWFDVLIVALPFARPLRIARSARLLRVGRLARVMSAAFRASHSLRALLEQHGLHYMLAVSMFLVVACAGAVTIIERDAGGNIQNFGDGLWWAATTVTTVGYGDRYPVTVEGRAIATFLMILGISLFSFITANIAAFLSKQNDADEPSLQELRERLRRIEELIRSRQPS